MANVFTTISERRTEVDPLTGFNRTFIKDVIHYDDGTISETPEKEIDFIPPEEIMRAGRFNLKSKIEVIRDEKIAAGAPTPSGVVDSDERSIRNIQGLVTMALVAQVNNQPFEKIFRFKDNTDKTLNAEQMIAVGVAAGLHVDAIYNHSWELKAKVEAATTPTELREIDLESGWPV